MTINWNWAELILTCVKLQLLPFISVWGTWECLLLKSVALTPGCGSAPFPTWLAGCKAPVGPCPSLASAQPCPLAGARCPGLTLPLCSCQSSGLGPGWEAVPWEAPGFQGFSAPWYSPTQCSGTHFSPLKPGSITQYKKWIIVKRRAHHRRFNDWLWWDGRETATAL